MLGLAIILLLSACTRSPDQRIETLIGEAVISAHNEVGISIGITAIVQTATFVELALDLHNAGASAIGIGDLDADPPPFILRSGGHEVRGSAPEESPLGIWTGYQEGQVSTSEAGHTIIHPGARIGLHLRFEWPAEAFANHRYAWSVEVGPIYPVGSEDPLPNIVHHEPSP